MEALRHIVIGAAANFQCIATGVISLACGSVVAVDLSDEFYYLHPRMDGEWTAHPRMDGRSSFDDKNA
jgi:hypothetical protein